MKTRIRFLDDRYYRVFADPMSSRDYRDVPQTAMAWLQDGVWLCGPFVSLDDAVRANRGVSFCEC